MTKRNTEGLLSTSQAKKDATDVKLQAAAEEMILNNEVITVSSLARKAGVSRVHIYKSQKWHDFVETQKALREGRSVSQEDVNSRNDKEGEADTRLKLAHEYIDVLKKEIDDLKLKNTELQSYFQDPVSYAETVYKLKEQLKAKDAEIQKLRRENAEKDKQLQTAWDWNKVGDLSKYRNKMIGPKDI